VPVSGGPGVAGVNETRQDVAWEGGSDFVFAFRVRKVMVEKNTRGVKLKDYTTGALLNADGDAQACEGLLLNVISDEEMDPDQDGLLSEMLMKGDEKFLCVLPSREG